MADSVFGDLGGSGKQSAGEPVPSIGSARDPAFPSRVSVFGDLGGPGQQHGDMTAPEPGSGDFPAY